MSRFAPPRFRRVLMNDALRVARLFGFFTLAALCLTVVVYLLNFERGSTSGTNAHQALFPIYLFGMGMIYTSVSFNDLHHPLERYQYLMLPCSNEERLLSRYLLTGPLFVLYVIVSFMLMDWLGNVLADWWIGAREPLFSPLEPGVRQLIAGYLLLHVVMFVGAICFRSYSLVRTMLAIFLLEAGLLAVVYLSLRIFYWDAFSWTSFSPTSPLRMQLLPLFEAHWLNVTIVIGLALWILFVAYRCLCGHEVQDEL